MKQSYLTIVACGFVVAAGCGDSGNPSPCGIGACRTGFALNSETCLCEPITQQNCPITACADGYVLDAARCLCVKDPATICQIRVCADGYILDEARCECVEGPRQCDVVKCVAGYTLDSSTCSCVPDGSECNVGACLPGYTLDAQTCDCVPISSGDDCGGQGKACCEPTGNLTTPGAYILTCDEGLMCCTGVPYEPPWRCHQECAISDRNLKENIAAISPAAVLARVVALPVSHWNYIADPDKVRHMGPMAQDFQAAFAVGSSDRRINLLDANGVALAAIQGLHQELKQLRDQNGALKRDIRRIRTSLQQTTSTSK